MANIQYFQDFDIFDVDPKDFKDAVAVVGGPNVIDVIFEPNFDSITITGFGFDVETKSEGLVDVVKGVNGGTVTFLSASINESLVLSISNLSVPLADIEKLVKKGDFLGILETFFAGNDSITFLGSGDEGVYGGQGTDTAVYSGNLADYSVTEIDDFVTVTDNRPNSPDGTDTLRGVENLAFQDQTVQVTNAEDGGLTKGGGGKSKKSGKSEINGTNGTEALDGTDGKDSIFGLDGDDILDGGDGKDKLFGGLGDDTYVLGKGDKAREEEGEGTDEILSSEKKVKAGKNIENVTLTSNGDGAIKGNNLDNDLIGNSGDNKIDGKKGEDLLIGLGGVDELKGGKDADLFQFRAVDALDVDIIRDFEIGEDKIDLSFIIVTQFSQFLDGAVQDGKDVVFTAGNGAQLVIQKTELEDLSADDFLFALF